ncbi:hypothetical protein B0I35DRAFT_410256 [Stachybotrys elegans]|uniref:NmrA-like domain-containing protein n=1 Tax=Stachybotrys elegans TaxID=80388 RepID=A0A8K0SP91_9HYPO|nr:hypothetical protein B0I35DRAFT_410256 [Stachybotrys elegans]
MATFQPSSILIIGATGSIGKYITDHVINAQPPFPQVTVLTSAETLSKKAAYLDELKSKGAKILTGDVTKDEDVRAAYEGVDTVISAVGRNVLETQINLIRLAEETPSVKWFFPSEYGTDIEYGPQSASEKPHQLKLKVRRYIKENVKRLHYTYIVTGPYVDMYFTLSPKAVEAGGFDIDSKKAVLIDNGEGKIGFTTMPDVGKAVVAALRHPEASFDKAIKVQSFVVSSKDILAEFEKQTGGEPWSVSHFTLQELKDREQEAWSTGQPNAVSYTLRRIWLEGGTLYDKTDNESIGLAASDLESLADSVHRALTTGW